MRGDDAKPDAPTPIAARAGLPFAVSLADGLALAAATPDGSPSSSSPRTPPSPASPWRGFTVGALQCGAPSDVASPGGAAGWAAAVEAAVADLAHPGTRAAALERLAVDPHAPTDVLECGAWPSLIAALPDALGDAACGDAAADFGERVVADAAAGDASALADVLAASAAALSRHGAPSAARLALAAVATLPAAWAAADEGELDRAAAGAAALLAPPARGAPPTPSPAAAALVDAGAATDWLAAWAATPRVAGRLFGALGRGALDAHAAAVAAVGGGGCDRPPALALSVATVGAALATSHGRCHLGDADGAAVALATLACAPGPPCGVAEAARSAVIALVRAATLAPRAVATLAAALLDSRRHDAGVAGAADALTLLARSPVGADAVLCAGGGRAWPTRVAAPLVAAVAAASHPSPRARLAGALAADPLGALHVGRARGEGGPCPARVAAALVSRGAPAAAGALAGAGADAASTAAAWLAAPPAGWPPPPPRDTAPVAWAAVHAAAALAATGPQAAVAAARALVTAAAPSFTPPPPVPGAQLPEWAEAALGNVAAAMD